MRPNSKLPDEIDVTSPAEAVEKFPELAALMEKKDDFRPVELKSEAPVEEPVEEPAAEPVEAEAPVAEEPQIEETENQGGEQ